MNSITLETRRKVRDRIEKLMGELHLEFDSPLSDAGVCRRLRAILPERMRELAHDVDVLIKPALSGRARHTNRRRRA